MNLEEGTEITLGFVQTLRQLVREWRAGLLGRGGAPAANRSLNEYQIQKVAIAQAAIADGAEGDVVLQDGPDGSERDGDTVKARNKSGASVAKDDKVVVSYPINGRWAILPRGSGTAPNLDFPEGTVDLQCGCAGKACVDGSSFHKCEECGCFHRKVYTRMPAVAPAPGVGFIDSSSVWAELVAITILRYWEGCKLRSSEFNGPEFLNEDDEETRDKYRIVEDFSGKTVELVRTVNNGGPLITLKFEHCGCARKCNCGRTYELAADGASNVTVPETCKVCISVAWPAVAAPKTPQTLCGPDNCVVELSQLASLSISGAGVMVPQAINGELGVTDDPVNKFSLNGDYRLVAGSTEGVCCGVDGTICFDWSGDREVLPTCYIDGQGDDLYTFSYEPGAAIVATAGDKYRIHAYVMVRVSIIHDAETSSYQSPQCFMSWASAEMTCEELNSAAESGSVELTPTECRDQGIPFQAEVGSATFRFTGGAQQKSTSTGHPGSICGGTDCSTVRCRMRVHEVTTPLGHTYNIFVQDESADCRFGDCGWCAPDCSMLTDPVLGNAADYEPGTILEKECDPEEPTVNAVTANASYAGGSGGCECGEGATARLCLSGENLYTGTLYLCNEVFSFSYYYDAEDGLYHLDGGPEGNVATSTDPEGPFYFFFGVAPPCDNFKIVITPGGG